jgi:hypothetical protein
MFKICAHLRTSLILIQWNSCLCCFTCTSNRPAKTKAPAYVLTGTGKKTLKRLYTGPRQESNKCKNIMKPRREHVTEPKAIYKRKKKKKTAFCVSQLVQK